MGCAETEGFTARTSFGVDFAELLAQTSGRYCSHGPTVVQVANRERQAYEFIGFQGQTWTNKSIPHKPKLARSLLLNVNSSLL